jgi:L-alanine-DL-glutamate epimerase-like enolase superfamily enzyme
VIHLALGAVVNAIWDLWAKSVNKPVWRLVADFTPEEFVRCIDFRYITDAITPDEAVKMLEEMEPTKAERIGDAERSRAVPAYTTSAGTSPTPRSGPFFSQSRLTGRNRMAWLRRRQDEAPPSRNPGGGIQAL